MIWHEIDEIAEELWTAELVARKAAPTWRDCLAIAGAVITVHDDIADEADLDPENLPLCDRDPEYRVLLAEAATDFPRLAAFIADRTALADMSWLCAGRRSEWLRWLSAEDAAALGTPAAIRDFWNRTGGANWQPTAEQRATMLEEELRADRAEEAAREPERLAKAVMREKPPRDPFPGLDVGMDEDDVEFDAAPD